ncbi:IS3 family transposase [Brevibacterium sp. JSBI002]|uniref:IS3 family transposase n=1 Tax=Brevibacterium sp. JSBI002 TaxID=2886045 RepID=UPI0039B6FDCB
MPAPSKYPAEVRDRAVRMVNEKLTNDPALAVSTACRLVGEQIGINKNTLRNWVKQNHVDSGKTPGMTTDDKHRITELEKEIRELRRANEILRKASAYFCPGGARPPLTNIDDFIDDNRDEFGVEPICRVLSGTGVQIAASSYYARKSRPVSERERSDAVWDERIQKVHSDNRGLFGARKIWVMLRRLYPDEPIARCTVERRMRALGLAGVSNARATTTTWQSKTASYPSDLVQRDFTADAPDTRWVADITYVPTWSGFVYVAFVMDLFSRMIVGWRVDTTLRTDLALDALEHALWERKRKTRNTGQLIHHSDKGSQYVSIAYTERLRESGIEASVGSTGDSYDNAAAEALNKLFKKEVVWREGPWTGRDAVEFATLEWVHWYNNTRPHSYCKDLAPAQLDEHYYTEASRSEVAGVPL